MMPIELIGNRGSVLEIKIFTGYGGTQSPGHRAIVSVMNDPLKRLGGSNRLVSMREASEYLNVSYKRFCANRESWGIPGVPVGARIKIRVRDLDAFIENHVERPKKTA
jgi:hypothetical protein